MLYKILTFSSYLISGNVSSDKLFYNIKKNVCIKTSALNAQYEMLCIFYGQKHKYREKKSNSAITIFFFSKKLQAFPS